MGKTGREVGVSVRTSTKCTSRGLADGSIVFYGSTIVDRDPGRCGGRPVWRVARVVRCKVGQPRPST